MYDSQLRVKGGQKYYSTRCLWFGYWRNERLMFKHSYSIRWEWITRQLIRFPHFLTAINAFDQCRSIQSLYKHCHWRASIILDFPIHYMLFTKEFPHYFCNTEPLPIRKRSGYSQWFSSKFLDKSTFTLDIVDFYNI